jgi:L-lactate utilization protein LutB
LLATIKDSFFFAILQILQVKKLKNHNPAYNHCGRHTVRRCYYTPSAAFATKKYFQTLNFCHYKADSQKVLREKPGVKRDFSYEAVIFNNLSGLYR